MHISFVQALLAVLLAAALGGCQTSRTPVLPAGQDAYAVIPAPDPAAVQEPYRLQPGDVIGVRVFQEPELTMERVALDESGNVQLPLIGELAAAGLTAPVLSDAIEDRLGARYIRNPRVVVSVIERTAAYVTVEGQVREPGVYQVDRDYTLLSALARAKSPTETAKLDQVVVFRTVEGRRAGAVFDLRAIRAGEVPDPRIIGGDTVVVGYSALRGAYRDFLQAAPILNLFTYF